MDKKLTFFLRQPSRLSTPWRILMHVAFWAAWLSRTLYDIVSLYSYKGAFIFSFSYIFTQMPFVYLHLYFLVPVFLNRNRYLIYIVSTVLLLFAYSYLSFFVLRHIPIDWFPSGMSGYIQSLNPNYDIIEGFFAFIITYSLKYTWLALTTQNKVLELEKDNLQLELNALKAQLNPHFLFNTLNNIYSLALTKSEKAPEMILKLSDMMRYVLYECNAPKVLMQKEIQFIYDYIHLEKIRHDENVSIDLQLTGNPDNSSIEPLLLIPFIENSFKHGVNSVIGKGWVKIQLNILNNQLSLFVENSTSGIESGNEFQKGIGLQNVKKRLQLLYHGKHTLVIDKKNKIFSVRLNIDMNSPNA